MHIMGTQYYAPNVADGNCEKVKVALQQDTMTYLLETRRRERERSFDVIQSWSPLSP